MKYSQLSLSETTLLTDHFVNKHYMSPQLTLGEKGFIDNLASPSEEDFSGSLTSGSSAVAAGLLYTIAA